MNILVVDESRKSNVLLFAHLARQGHIVQCAADDNAALAMQETLNPGVIVLLARARSLSAVAGKLKDTARCAPIVAVGKRDECKNIDAWVSDTDRLEMMLGAMSAESHFRLAR